MSFEKLDIRDKEVKEGRNCMIVCNFNAKDIKKITNYGAILGIKDQIVISAKNGDSIIRDVLEDKISSECENGQNQRAIIFNSISPAKISIFMDNLKKLRINNVLVATVTETSIGWTINTVINNLVAERIALKNGDNVEH